MAALVIGLGGAIGAVARYLLTDWVRAIAGDAFPWGTLAVNVLGSFLIGFMLLWLQSVAPSTQARQFAVIGVLGSFTTFSTFSYETVALVRTGEIWRAGGYATGSMALGLIGVLAGAAVAAWMTGRG
ncbi:MAG: fluoride efflux transporter CrcB [Gemmatimonadetes bacterium]|nr:fluoride efflux transporter CrcB [Gemmatimonadota bacterium]MDA1102008.1 fluoride efflux transporter CrcB [Gemmatimonadota bacterium]